MLATTPNPSTANWRKTAAVAGWTLWSLLIILWIASLVPFYSHGLNSVSDLALEYAGEGEASQGIGYAPPPGEVYNAPLLGTFAQSVVCLGPVLFVAALALVFWRVRKSWRSYSLLGGRLRIAAVVLTLALVVLSYNRASLFLIWGLG